MIVVSHIKALIYVKSYCFIEQIDMIKFLALTKSHEQAKL